MILCSTIMTMPNSTHLSGPGPAVLLSVWFYTYYTVDFIEVSLTQLAVEK